MAMVTTVELDDPGAAGGGARDANRGHPRFRAGADQAHLASHRDGGRDALGDLDFQLSGSPVTEAAAGLIGDRRDDLGMGVSDDRGTVGADVIDEAVAVGIDEHRALSVCDEERRATDRLPCAHRRIDGAGDHRGGSREQRGGIFLRVHTIALLANICRRASQTRVAAS